MSIAYKRPRDGRRENDRVEIAIKPLGWVTSDHDDAGHWREVVGLRIRVSDDDRSPMLPTNLIIKPTTLSSVVGSPIWIRGSYLRPAVVRDAGRDLEEAPSPISPEWTRILRDLDSWADFPDDWDGEDGRAPGEHVIEAGRQLMRHLIDGGSTPPEHYVAGDGEIGFRWRSDKGYASASLLEDGSLLLYMHVADEVLHDLDTPWHPNIDIGGFLGDLARLA